ncbi:putative lipoprotein [[Clostridium] bifermentans ATCC 638]|uniref:Putative lipoprotein n=1 Tax=Paraclostridium bifermentans ATCC 638 = DSM 14991 TaxID=1233171 RepID=T4VNP3_PARBF|nr:hypothetical protein [Paraclostridium bifermentans]EQK42750.1 putative lipoprotein [[Clostridium] bifermentans ATCC 638] [Paraclostridium bifermentans ATCC 638 = DSM 14991]RIZ58430.1 hypothetical protein CHH45_11430 [Paraclostridium bifermentans]UAG19549.1 hypothetical protein KXZ80_07520 [Paraclostridium bifermentans]
MYLKKLSVIFSISILILSSCINTIYALDVPPSDPFINSIDKDLDFLDSNMYVLIKSIASENLDVNAAKKQISFVRTLIYDLTEKASDLPKEQYDVASALQAILGFYKLSILEANKYIDSKNSDDLISSINAFSMGYTASINLRNIVFRAGK